MRYSLKNRICAVLLCCCMLFTTGCFACHSILGVDNNEYYDIDSSITLDFEMDQENTVASGVYPTGTRAFMFKNCTYEADIGDFKLIDHRGDVFIYYYTGITVIGDGPDEYGNTENKKGYYDKTNAKLDYFWTVASYNFDTQEYTEIHKQSYDPVADAGKMNCNPCTTCTTPLYSSYLVNIGYYFIFFAMGSYESRPNYFVYIKDSWVYWKLSASNKKTIRNKLGIKNDENRFCCTDLAIKNLNGDPNKYAASFMELPDKNSTNLDFDQKNVMFEVQLKSENNDNQIIRTIELVSKENSILPTAGGNLISSNAASGNCIYVLDQSGKKIKFGIDNRDRKTSFDIELDQSQKEENNVLQSFSVEDWVYKNSDGYDVVSDQESILELVFKNRVIYYKIERYTSWGIIYYRAVYQKTYPLSSFSSTYLSSDDIPSVGFYSHGINLSSTEDGFKCINTSGNVLWSYTNGAAFFSTPYGEKTIIVGFDGFTFEETITYQDKDGEVTRTVTSQSEFTLAQLPFASVVIV